MGTRINLDTKKLGEFRTAYKRMDRNFRKAGPIVDTIEDSAHEMRNYIISRMTSTPKQETGYKRGNKIHYPSKIKNFPARDSGELVRSIRVETRGMKIELGSKSGAPYSKYLEDLDSRYTEKTRRRFIRPTFNHFIPKINLKLMQVIRKYSL